MENNVIAASIIIEDLLRIRNTIGKMRFPVDEADNIMTAKALYDYCDKRIAAYTPPKEEEKKEE